MDRVPSMHVSMRHFYLYYHHTHFVRLDEWQEPWSNKNSQSDLIRKHLISKHSKLYREVVVLKKLKNWETVDQLLKEKPPREPFSLPGFYERLIRWITVDDQVLRFYINNFQSNLLIFTFSILVSECNGQPRTP